MAVNGFFLWVSNSDYYLLFLMGIIQYWLMNYKSMLADSPTYFLTFYWLTWLYFNVHKISKDERNICPGFHKIRTLLSDLSIPKNILCNISFTFDPDRNHPYYYCDAVFSGEMYSIAVMTSLASASGVITPTVGRLVQTTGTPGLQDTGLMSSPAAHASYLTAGICRTYTWYMDDIVHDHDSFNRWYQVGVISNIEGLRH